MAEIGAEPPSAKAEFFIAVAGPIVSLALALLFSVAQPVVAAIQPLWGLVEYLAYINFALVLFNLIPGFPLDGGRVFRAVVWAATKSMRSATLVAANAGRFFGFLFIFTGVWRMFHGNLGGGLWIAFIGWFLDHAATTQIHQLVFRDLLAGHTVAQSMNTHLATVSADLTVQQLVEEHILGSGQRCLLVTRAAETVGMITLHRIKGVLQNDWAATRVAQIMLPFNQLKCTAPDTPLWTALEQMDRGEVNQLPVTRDNRVLGMLSRESVTTFMRTLQELGG